MAVEQALFSDGQVAAIVSGVLAAGAAVAGSIKWAVSRLVTSNDVAIQRLVKAMDDMSANDERVKEVLIELRTVVHEGRADIAEIRDLIDRYAQPPERPSSRAMRRPRTDPALPTLPRAKEPR